MQTSLPKLVAVAIAGVLGALAGGLAVTLLPADRFAWSGFALLPLFVLLESSLRHATAAFDGDANAARVWLAGAMLVCFYAAWFALRSP